jgi:hypothetical protein
LDCINKMPIKQQLQPSSTHKLKPIKVKQPRITNQQINKLSRRSLLGSV